MNIKVLCDDRITNYNFEQEHGFSLLITTEKHCILFDTGQSDVFLKNADKLGVDLCQVDTVVLSHGHYDHCNGLLHFLRVNTKASVYMHRGALNCFMHGNKYIGAHPILKEHSDRYHFLTDEFYFDDEISIVPSSVLPSIVDNEFTIYADGKQTPDTFDHEIYLLCKHNQKKVLFTGCSHRGIVHIAQYAVSNDVTHIVGGFHLTDTAANDDVMDIIHDLSMHPLQYFTGHCTSHNAWERMHRTNPRQFHLIKAGDQFAIGTHGEVASALFRQGYNCSQAVLGAFAEELNLNMDTAMKIACSFGGGIGRMREVCGAVSGMMMVCGMIHGYSTPETGSIKAEHYRLVQKLASEFRSKTGSIICRDLLGGAASSLPTPTERTKDFYAKRPCERLIYLAASILEERFFEEN